MAETYACAKAERKAFAERERFPSPVLGNGCRSPKASGEKARMEVDPLRHARSLEVILKGSDESCQRAEVLKVSVDIRK